MPRIVAEKSACMMTTKAASRTAVQNLSFTRPPASLTDASTPISPPMHKGMAQKTTRLTVPMKKDAAIKASVAVMGLAPHTMAPVTTAKMEKEEAKRMRPKAHAVVKWEKPLKTSRAPGLPPATAVSAIMKIPKSSGARGRMKKPPAMNATDARRNAQRFLQRTERLCRQIATARFIA